jgi:hypothetical protein
MDTSLCVVGPVVPSERLYRQSSGCLVQLGRYRRCILLDGAEGVCASLGAVLAGASLLRWSFAAF